MIRVTWRVSLFSFKLELYVKTSDCGYDKVTAFVSDQTKYTPRSSLGYFQKATFVPTLITGL